MNENKPKRDYLFIDESGDPGTFSNYYILGAIHLTDLSLKEINPKLGALRYFGNIRRELHSTRLNDLQKDHLFNILKTSVLNNDFIKASAIYINKSKYIGPYLNDKISKSTNSNYFRSLMIRRLLEFHFKKFQPQTSEIELVIDRFLTGEEAEQKMKNYLRTDKYKILPKFLHITQADSRYVELLQVADWIAGSVKDKYFKPDRTIQEELFKYINVSEVIK